MKNQDSSLKTHIFKSAKMGAVISALLILSSCLSIKPGGAKSGAKLYETFFVGEEGTQYFIKPLKFIDGNNNQLDLDITFRYKNAVKDSAVLNISFLSDIHLRSFDSLRIDNGDNAALVKEVNLLFTERSKDMYKSRVSSKVSLAELKVLFAKTDWVLTSYRNGDSAPYTATKTTGKKIAKLNYEIFELF